MASSNRQKIIIDTDCGIDDAIALLLAVSKRERGELLAITCCFGNTTLDNVVSNVKRVLTVCEESALSEIPIYKGCSGPLIKSNVPDTQDDPVHGSDGLGNCAHRFSTGDWTESDIPAPMALINLAKAHPKEITLVVIGPMTNVALAHRMDPKFTENLKSIVIMGGNYKGVGNVTEVGEFNFYCDPEAANIVVTESLCPVVLVPWETTMKYGIKWDLYNELITFDTPKGNFFKHISRQYAARSLRSGRARYYDCDFLAVVAVLYPNCVTATFKRRLHVDYESNVTRGLTVLLRDIPEIESRVEVEIITDYDMDFLDSVRIGLFFLESMNSND